MNMEFDKRTVLISLVVLIIAAVVVFNFEKFTGQATGQGTQVTRMFISENPAIPNQETVVVDKGKAVYFTAIAGSEGSDGTLEIKHIEEGRTREQIVSTVVFDNCNSKRCNFKGMGTPFARINTYYDWEGEYCGVIKDFATEKEIRRCFRVR